MTAAGPLAHLADRIDSFVDDIVGIVSYVVELPGEAGAPDFFHFYAKACDTSAFCRQANSRDAGGASVRREDALAKAIGEAIERYCSAIFERDDYQVSTFNDAPFPCVPPSDFALYTEHQYRKNGFPFVPFGSDTPVRWVPAQNLNSGETEYVPAAMVFVPYAADIRSGEKPILQPISTGLACHVGAPRAALSAVCEVIERDAFTINWQAGLAPPRVSLETLSRANKDLIGRFEAIGAEVSLFLLRMDHPVPVVLSALRLPPCDGPALVFALSCHLDPEIAVRKSLEELAHSYRFCRLLKTTMPMFRPSPSFSNVVDRDAHVALYCDQANTELAAFLFSSKTLLHFESIENLSSEDPTQDLQALSKIIAHTGHRVLLVDVTTPDVAALGFSVVRAIIPGFHPLCIGHHLRALGGERLREVPVKLGYQRRPKHSRDNGLPHPLP